MFNIKSALSITTPSPFLEIQKQCFILSVGNQQVNLNLNLTHYDIV